MLSAGLININFPRERQDTHPSFSNGLVYSKVHSMINREEPLSCEDETLHKFLVKCEEKESLTSAQKIEIITLASPKKDLSYDFFKRPWTRSEEKDLLNWLNEGSCHGWDGVTKQIKEKYIGKVTEKDQFLSVASRKSRWSKEEDMSIFVGCRIYGSKWSKIAKLVPGRTEDAIRNRLYGLLKLFRLEHQKSTPNLNSNIDLNLPSPKQTENELDLQNDKKDDSNKEKSLNTIFGDGGCKQKDFNSSYDFLLSQKSLVYLFDSALNLLKIIMKECFSKHENQIEHVKKILGLMEKFHFNLDRLILNKALDVKFGQDNKFPSEGIAKSFILRTCEVLTAVSTIKYYYRMNFQEGVKKEKINIPNIEKDNIKQEEEEREEEERKRIYFSFQLTSLDTIASKINDKLRILQKSIGENNEEPPSDKEMVKSEDSSTTCKDSSDNKSNPPQSKIVLVMGKMNVNLEKLCKQNFCV